MWLCRPVPLCIWLAATHVTAPLSLPPCDVAHIKHRASVGSAVCPGPALQRLLLRGGVDADCQDDETASSVPWTPRERQMACASVPARLNMLTTADLPLLIDCRSWSRSDISALRCTPTHTGARIIYGLRQPGAAPALCAALAQGRTGARCSLRPSAPRPTRSPSGRRQAHGATAQASPRVLAKHGLNPNTQILNPKSKARNMKPENANLQASPRVFAKHGLGPCSTPRTSEANAPQQHLFFHARRPPRFGGRRRQDWLDLCSY